MASIYPRGNKWWVRLKQGGKWISRPTDFVTTVPTDKRNAQRYADKRQAAIDEQEGGIAPAGDVTVRAYALETWIKQREADDLDWKNDRGRLLHHVLPHIGDHVLADVRAKHLADLVRTIRTTSGLAPRSIYNVWSVVSALFRDAAVAGEIESNPCPDIGVRQLGPLTDKDPEWRAGAVFTRDEAEVLISHPEIPLDRRLYYAFELLAGMRPGEIAARRWRDYDPAAVPLAKLTISTAFSTPKNKVKSTKTNATKIIPLHATLGAMLAEWRAQGWAAMMGRAPEADDLILPLPPAELLRRRTRCGEAIRVGDWAARRWRDVDLKMLGWRHRRMYDGKATMITLAVDDGASRDVIKNRVTHAKAVRDAFDHYYRGTEWAVTCAELSKLRIVRRDPASCYSACYSDGILVGDRGAGEGIRTIEGAGSVPLVIAATDGNSKDERARAGSSCHELYQALLQAVLVGDFVRAREVAEELAGRPDLS